MKRIVHTDKHGYKRVYALRDDDDESKAHQGIPLGPPDLRVLDWENIVKDLNNALVDMGIVTIEDLNFNNNGISTAINGVVRGKILELYKEYRSK